MQNIGKSALRVAKNSIKGYSDVQTKVRDATSNDAWGPSGTQMSEIAALTFNQNDFVEIIEMVDKRLNDKGKNWRHVFKSLTLLDYLLHSGSENVVMYFRENMYVVKTLKEFQYIDEYGKDQGANVRQKAKDITNLLLDEKRMRDSRKNRANMNGRLQGDGGDRARSSMDDRGERDRAPRRAQSVPPERGGDRDLAAAIAASKASAEEEARRGQKTRGGDAEMEEAMRLSREEDARRRAALAAQNGASLFDEQRQNDNLIDIDSNFQVQQPMMTGMPLQSFNPYAQQQQQLQQEEWARQQQMMELQRQADEQQAYQNMLFAQQQQQQQDEYARQQQYLQQQYMQQQQQQQQQMQPLVSQPTAFGSNNPFAAFGGPAPAASPPPPLPTSNSFTNYPTQQQQAPAPAPASAPRPAVVARPPRDDGQHAHLASLLAAGRDDGLDTFGNVGNMRVPVGAQFAQKTGLGSQQTGSRPNPFLQQQQQPREQTLFDF